MTMNENGAVSISSSLSDGRDRDAILSVVDLAPPPAPSLPTSEFGPDKRGLFT